ncbi:btk-binding protein-related [Anaeramoeba flamelloides]|uniref:Btk-binding protein-related n=1 Tax=Anaeramoeba flamelloides TaxID=1746091 RepID=A0ABQ8Z611_9EUKA|nr:btk-binding protein-related [Anaeramoeba flamelloides]
MSKSSSLYLSGSKNRYSFLIKKNKNNLPKWSEIQIKKTQTIKKLVCGGGPHFLVWKKPNKLEFYQKDIEKRKYQLPKNETIKDIISSRYTYLILTESGKVWSLAYRSLIFKEVPLLDADQSTFEEIRPVTKIFAGVNSPNFFFVTSQPDLLYACGKNKFGELGLGSIGEEIKPTAVYNHKGSEILTLSSCHFHSFLITNKGQTFGCGQMGANGHGVQKTVFTLIPQIKEKKVVQLATGLCQTLVLTDQNELYGLGFKEDFFPTDKENNLNKNRIFSTKINLPSFFTKYLESKDQIRIACGSYARFLYLDFKNTLSQDLRLLYKSKKFCDCEIGNLGNQIPVHKNIVECRTKLTIDQIQNKLFGEEKSIDKDQILSFLKWIYYDEISDFEKLEQTFDLLELTFPPSVDNTLEKDIAQLSQDDDSKDFKILVKNDDEEDEEEEDNYEEIPVHKFILLARSGLFREMFDNVNEKDNLNKVQDYSNKSIESLEILIKYFYTNSIELTADQDPKLIVDELSDAVEYYQLNDQNNLENQLSIIQKKYNLN